MFIIHKMLVLKWVPAFEIMKIRTVALKIGYTFYDCSVSAEILHENSLLENFRFPVFVLKTTCFLKYFILSPPKMI